MTEIKVAAGALAVSALFLVGVTLRPEARVARLPLPASITLGRGGSLWSDRPAVAKPVGAIPVSPAPMAEIHDQTLKVVRIPRAVRSGADLGSGPSRGQRQQASTMGRGSIVAPDVTGVPGASGAVTSGPRVHPAETPGPIPAVPASSSATIAPAPVVLATTGPTGKVQQATADDDDEDDEDDEDDDDEGGNSGPGGGGSSGSNSGPGSGDSGGSNSGPGGGGSDDGGSGGSGSGGGGSGGGGSGGGSGGSGGG